uniref:NADH dehydrogenase subunit 2 n=1 Tax=Helicosporidium sp. subsp. Simulium jonesii TaxID=145475 RepID=D3IZW5_HELSJ|nr:NADH dehydrogenase subunit 2 [Helicosporidium sp. ex Simulium jonesi]ACT36191.1 NADH dehydrogenase subunit 2 [Helicosporidium sp. ex Simulium jonesi]
MHLDQFQLLKQSLSSAPLELGLSAVQVKPYYKQLTFTSYLFDNDFLTIIPEMYLVSMGLFLLLFGCVYSTSSKLNYPLLSTNIGWFTLLSFFYTFLLIQLNPINNATVLYNTLIIDDFTQFIKICTLLASIFSLLISLKYIKNENYNAFESMILILFSTASMLFCISSSDFISMYLAVELQSLCFYVLAAFKRNSEFSTESGLKYFILGAFSSGFLLFGCSLIYAFTGTLNFAECAKLFAFTGQLDSIGTNYTLDILTLSLPKLGMIFLLVGFLFKIAAAPFHMWSPDVYEGAPTPVTAFFVITPKLTYFAVFLRIFYQCFYDLFDIWQMVLILASLASMIVGAIGGLSQTKIKRLVAFSSIGHVGYLLIGFACGSIEGIHSLCLYLIIYIFMNIAMFGILLSGLLPADNKLPNMKYITDLAYLGKTNPILAITLAITLFSMAGIPPLAGFYSKAYLFFAALSNDLGLLAIIGVLTSVCSCFYYIRLIRIMYFTTPKNWYSTTRVSKTNAIALALSLYILVFFMFYPSPLFLLTHKATLALCL